MRGVRVQKEDKASAAERRARRSALAEGEEEESDEEDKSSVVTLLLTFLHVNLLDMKGRKNSWNLDLLRGHKCSQTPRFLRHLHGRVPPESRHLLLCSCEDMCEICHLLRLIHRGCECSFALCCDECGEKTPHTSHMVKWKAPPHW